MTVFLEMLVSGTASYTPMFLKNFQIKEKQSFMSTLGSHKEEQCFDDFVVYT